MLASFAVYVAVVAGGCVNPTSPVDAVLNLVPVPQYGDLRAHEPTLVVLQHGLSRSAWSLWRLERALESHGYEVLNESYPSTQMRIEDHAERLSRALEHRLAERRGPPPRLVFVGHSMGGLVIRSYLARPGARHASACVFIATPHHGATLVEKRKNLFVFGLFLGNKAALQLERGNPFFDTLGPVPCDRVGCIYGGLGDDEGRNDDIPGDDDGTVSTTEAQLEGQSDSIMLPYGHTMLSMVDATIEQVLVFLYRGSFEHRK
ncbi:MAG: alpha/beta fold hydrolase [Planctomycetes bacterium]|nr:alpha/beta fold hydrolase [Planctomycetota bacterium]